MTKKGWFRAVCAAAALCAGTLVLAQRVHAHYPIQDWLFFRYLGHALACAAMAAGCLLAGYRLVTVLCGSGLGFCERVLLGFACGVLAFGLGVFVAGALGLYGPVLFFALPLLLAACGGSRSARSIAHGASRLLARSSRTHLSAAELARLSLLALGLLAVYLQVLAPDNVSFDARWYHVAIAEQYAVHGGIRRFDEGWYLAAYPQLATWLYTWAFCLPADLFGRVTLASHVEWTLFVATVPGVGLLARRLLRGAHAHVRFGGAALFLFPSLLLYDSNLNTGADHVLAFWAIPLALALRLLYRARNARSLAVVTALAAGAALTKYQAVYLLAPAALVTLAVLARARRLSLLLPALGLGLALTAPHWLKNALYYGDPLYPLLHRMLPAQPFHAGAASAMREGYFPARFLLQGSALERMRDTLEAALTFSLVPHNWKGMQIPEPTFGSVFTLACLALPFVRASRRLWLLVGATHLGVVIWFATNHQDRFLQALVPWMAAAIVALGALAWRLGAASRLAFCALLALQLVWSADMVLYPTHKMIGASTVQSLASLVAAGHGGPKARRERLLRWGNLGAATEGLPRDARLLLHDGIVGLGLGRRTLSDQWGFQGAISYRELGSAQQAHRALRRLGVTHLVWKRDKRKRVDRETLARQAVFHELAAVGAHDARGKSGVFVAALRAEPPAARKRVLRIETCKPRDPKPGTFTIEPRAPRGTRDRGALRPVEARAREVSLLALHPACVSRSAKKKLTAGMRKQHVVGGLELWVRR